MPSSEIMSGGQPMDSGTATDTGNLVQGASVRSGKCEVSLVILQIDDSEERSVTFAIDNNLLFVVFITKTGDSIPRRRCMPLLRGKTVRSLTWVETH